MTSVRLEIFGGGPYRTYAMERLTTSAVQHESVELESHVFERNFQFGAGQVHSSSQAPTAFLGRAAGHVSFGADEGVVEAGPLLPGGLRTILLCTWHQRKFEETRRPHFDNAPDRWSKRYVHGLALHEHLPAHVDLRYTRPSPFGSVRLRHHELVDVVDLAEAPAAPASQHIVSAPVDAGADGPDVETVVERVLLLTGHTPNGSLGFERNGSSEPRSVPSGREPRSTVTVSESGPFSCVRPLTAPGVGAQFRGKGVFLAVGAVRRLPEDCGHDPGWAGEVSVRQMGYERHLFPHDVAGARLLCCLTLLLGQHLTEVPATAREHALADRAGAAAGQESVGPLTANRECGGLVARRRPEALFLGRTSGSTLVTGFRSRPFDALLRPCTDLVLPPSDRERPEAVLDAPVGTASLVAVPRLPARHAVPPGSAPSEQHRKRPPAACRTDGARSLCTPSSSTARTPIHPASFWTPGLVRAWRNPHVNGGGESEPGGLNLTDGCHLIRPDGTSDWRVTVPGPAIGSRRPQALSPRAPSLCVVRRRQPQPSAECSPPRPGVTGQRQWPDEDHGLSPCGRTGPRHQRGVIDFPVRAYALRGTSRRRLETWPPERLPQGTTDPERKL
ncbi:hypothetical protein ACFUTR_21275 [Streptomyces sp. NPDC057367]|uniref:hypothetical protein n=1 Tax=Streptomyces sp. NPDC057367 TaxID=3346108 RepID=UPI00362796BC